MACEPESSVAQPRAARVHTRTCPLRLEVAQDGRGRRGVLEAVVADCDGIAAAWHPPLPTVDARALSQFRRLRLGGRPQVMPAVVDHMERQQTQRQPGLERSEVQGREVLHPSASVLREAGLDAPACGGGGPGRVRGHGTRRGDQRARRAVAPVLQPHPHRPGEGRHGRGDGGHIAPHGALILVQGDRVVCRQALGRTRARGQDRDATRGVAFLEQLPAVPRFGGDHEAIPPQEGARQTGQPAGDVGDGRAGRRRAGAAGLLRLLVMGGAGAPRLAGASLLGEAGVLHRLPGGGWAVVGVDMDRLPRRALAARNQAVPQGGRPSQAVLPRDVLAEAVLGGRRREHGETGAPAAVRAADRIASAAASRGATAGREDEAQGEVRPWAACPLGRSPRRREGGGATVEQGREAAAAASAGGGQPACEAGGHVLRDGVTGDDAWTRRARVSEDGGRLRGEEPRWEWRGCDRFFFDRPAAARTCPTRLARTSPPNGVNASAMSSMCSSVSKRLRMSRASTAWVRCGGVGGPVLLGRRAARDPWRTAVRRA